MSAELDENLVERLDELDRLQVSGEYHRYTGARRDPLSGAGARANGGRWNPRGIYPTIYLATPRASCAGEVRRAAEALGTTPDVMLQAPYLLHTVHVANIAVLDLSDPQAMDHVGLTDADLSDDDWTACQAVGHAAWFLGFQGVLAKSASGTGVVLAAFEGRIELPQLSVVASDEFTPMLYATLIA